MVSLIPIPRKLQENDGYFEFDKNTKVFSEIDIDIKNCQHSDDGNFKILLDKSLAEEGYRLTVTPSDIIVSAGGYQGAVWALQTLRQLGKFDIGERKIPCVDIEDSPQFKWRGIGLDESRHFFGKEEVKNILEMMSFHKLNVFHWHLTDDQGWRIEIKKFPLLTEIGSKRKCSQIHGWHSKDILDEPHQGFYTQQDIKELVDYAKKLGIMIVPEIDMPAHFAAAIAAYPNLACREIETEVPGYFGGKIPESQGNKDWNRTACLGKQTTFNFVFGVLDEVCDLFPAPYFHIGGDEAPRNEWKKCELCQKVIKDNNLKSEDELQGYFNNKILDYVEKKGKRLIGWNEILKSKNLDNSVIGQYWTPKRDKNAEKYINNGGELILSRHQSFYFDMTYAMRSLKDTYEFSPVQQGIKWASKPRILGVEGEVWSEWIDSKEKLDCYLYPRMEALSEVAWSPDYIKNWSFFMLRLEEFKPILDKLNINYAVNKVSCPKGLAKKIKIKKNFICGDTHMEVKLNQKYKSKGEK